MQFTRRLATTMAVLAMVIAFGRPVTFASADPSGASCELEGQFRIIPSLKTEPNKIHYTIKGRANDCHWTDGSTESGDFTARGSGIASCSQGTTTGVAHIAWDDHATSTMNFTTENRGNAVVLDGRFVKGESKGYDAHGLLFFVVDKNEPLGCFTEFGLNRATFYGVCERVKL